jgi:TrmH family RNA methyltransferase
MAAVQRISSRNARFQVWQSLLTNRNKRQRAGEFLRSRSRSSTAGPFVL